MTTTRILAVLCLVALVGCTTPEPVLREAKLTTQMMLDLETQLNKFQQQTNTEDTIRSRVIAEQRQQIEINEDELKQYSPETVSAVNKGEAETYVRVKKRADASRAALEKARQPISPMVLAPLPDSKVKLAAAQTATSPLGAELDAATRFKTAKEFVDGVREGVKANDQKIAEAKAQKPAGAEPTGKSP